VGLNLNDAVWAPSGFTKHRERLLGGDVAQAFSEPVLAQACERHRWSDEHRTVDGPLLEAWAGQQRVKRTGAETPKVPPEDPGNASIACRGEWRTNATDRSTTDPEARLYTKAKGQEVKLRYVGHVVMENCHGLVVHTRVTHATGTAARESATAGKSAPEVPSSASSGAECSANSSARCGLPVCSAAMFSP
jgi:hypothetical protein